MSDLEQQPVDFIPDWFGIDKGLRVAIQTPGYYHITVADDGSLVAEKLDIVKDEKP